jgi:hypothetical protein
MERAMALGLWMGLMVVPGVAAVTEEREVFSDTWVATDGLGRRLPGHEEVGPPRADRTVGMFYFLWLGAHIQGGPYDVTRILKEEPGAMQNPDSPRWGPLHAPHHWGESLFGYYLTDDASVLRKHGQMLSDAGVDMVVFDVTNQLTYREWYRALFRVWGDMRAMGNRTPQVAFLAPFWDPAKVVRELWRDLYEPGVGEDLWFQWEGRPLILADPDLLEPREEQAEQSTPVVLETGKVLGQTFTARRAFRVVGGRFPTWQTRDASVTLTLRRGGPGGAVVASQRFLNVPDNAWLELRQPEATEPGVYYLEAGEVKGRMGWWSEDRDVWEGGEAWAEGEKLAGDRTLRFRWVDPEVERIRRFFTFRTPQPDYFRGPLKPDMWSWLEVSPQHGFTNALGQVEQVSVGVGQNAVGGRLGSMSEAGARGRSFHGGRKDPRPEAVRYGFNVAEQWDRARSLDPRVVFITGWNEWIAGRFAEFNGVREPVMFVDQFDSEHSRDIEPVRGLHGDDYYWQLVAEIRRYKGVRDLIPVKSASIHIDGDLTDWEMVGPEYRDTVGDEVRRRHRGWDATVTYVNQTGRNDLVSSKVSLGEGSVDFLVRTRAMLDPAGRANELVLLLDVDRDASTGWLGYEVVVNRREPGDVERHVGTGYAWEPVGRAAWARAKDGLELSLPWRLLGVDGPGEGLDFKWADSAFERGDWTELTLNGDVAPNDRFNYRVRPGR